MLHPVVLMIQLDVQLFLERTNPHMLPAASSTFFTLDRRMDGEVRYKVCHRLTCLFFL